MILRNLLFVSRVALFVARELRTIEDHVVRPKIAMPDKVHTGGPPLLLLPGVGVTRDEAGGELMDLADPGRARFHCLLRANRIGKGMGTGRAGEVGEHFTVAFDSDGLGNEPTPLIPKVSKEPMDEGLHGPAERRTVSPLRVTCER